MTDSKNVRCGFTAAVVLSMLTTAWPGHAAVAVEAVRRSQAHYSVGIMQPAADTELAWWFDEDRVSLSTAEWRIVLDRAQKRVWFIDLGQERFVTTRLPVESGAIVDESLDARLAKYRMNGQRRKSAPSNLTASSEDGGKTHHVTEWIVFDRNRFFDRDRDLRASTDVPFDWRMAHQIRGIVHGLFGAQPDYLRLLASIEGFVTWESTVRYEDGNAIEQTLEVVGVAEKSAPDGVFRVPEGFAEEQHLTFEDLFALRSLFFPM